MDVIAGNADAVLLRISLPVEKLSGGEVREEIIRVGEAESEGKVK